MKYENPFHRLPLEKDTFGVKIYIIPVEGSISAVISPIGLYKISLTEMTESLKI